MYVEKRKFGERTKYYLVHSYRDKSKVKKIRRYLGQDLTGEALKQARNKAEPGILKALEELSTEVFLFSLTKNQVDALNRYDSKINIPHLDLKDWERFTEEFVYHTNAIEGSTVARDDVPVILNKKQARTSDEIETKGVAKAVRFIMETEEELSLNMIKKLHKLCFNGSKDFAGKLRDVEVVIRNANGDIVHTGIPARNLDYALKDMVLWYKENKAGFKPLVLAAIIHNQFEYIHPFRDGNGRVGRLLLNYVLLKNSHPPINISIEDRAEYYSTLNDYSKNNDLRPTLKFLIRQYRKTLKKATTKR